MSRGLIVDWRGFDAWQVGGGVAGHPRPQARGPIGDRVRRIGGRDGVVALLEAQIQKIAGDIRDGRIGLVLG